MRHECPRPRRACQNAQKSETRHSIVDTRSRTVRHSTVDPTIVSRHGPGFPLAPCARAPTHAPLRALLLLRARPSLFASLPRLHATPHAWLLHHTSLVKSSRSAVTSPTGSPHRPSLLAAALLSACLPAHKASRPLLLSPPASRSTSRATSLSLALTTRCTHNPLPSQPAARTQPAPLTSRSTRG